MERISDTARAAREAARVSGQFGEQLRTAPDSTLSRFTDPDAPLDVAVVLESDERDQLVEVDRVIVNLRPILDKESLADIESDLDCGDHSRMFASLEQGGTIEHDGPFELLFPVDIREYIKHRRANGQLENVPGAGDREAAIVMRNRAAVLDRADELARYAGDHATRTTRVDALQPGDVLMQGQYRVQVDEVSESSAMPGFIMVETTLGTMYMDPEQDVDVEIDF